MKKKDLIPGRWYKKKTENNSYRKASLEQTSSSSLMKYSERIIIVHSYLSANVDTANLELVSNEEISPFLPEGHPDKIKNYELW